MPIIHPYLINLHRSRLTWQWKTRFIYILSSDLSKLRRQWNVRNMTTKMVPKPITIDNIMTKFTIKTIPKMKGETNWKVIIIIMQLLYVKTTTLTTPQYGGYHIHIELIMKPTLYTTLPNTSWLGPVEPGVLFNSLIVCRNIHTGFVI